MRVAGAVIWATDLRETRSNSGGGKGRPRTVSYSYSASWRCALSARPIRAVRRIWADGKLLRGSAGDFKTETEFRFYTGDEDQAADPLIAAAEGAKAPCLSRACLCGVRESATRGLFGNRIPSLSFEVEADAGPVPIGAVAAALGGGRDAKRRRAERRRLPCKRESIRGAIEELAAFVPLSLVDDGQALRIECRPSRRRCWTRAPGVPGRFLSGAPAMSRDAARLQVSRAA
jgi:hypothetical protein